MLYDKVLSKFGNVKLSTAAALQYDRANDEIKKLCEFSSIPWGLIDDRWFQKVCKTYFVSGCVCTALVGGTAIYAYKKIKEHDNH